MHIFHPPFMGVLRYDLTGQRFGRWYVLYRAPNVKKRVLWHCICDCGVERDVLARSLRTGMSTSCGCYHKEVVTTHGDSGSELYDEWQNMRSRCLTPSSGNYYLYGARGVCICDEWDDYTAFRDWALENGWSEGMTLDRIDPYGDYAPGNCRWADRKMQANNRRNSHYVEIDGVRKTVTEWAEENGVNPKTAFWRITLGWDERDAVSRH